MGLFIWILIFDDRDPAVSQGPQTMGIMGMFLIMGNAGCISSTVARF